MSDVVMLPAIVARNLEVLMGFTEERCRRCASFDPMPPYNLGRGRCSMKHKAIVAAGDRCERFLLKYRLR